MQALSTSTQTPFAAGSAIRRLIGLGQARGGTLIWIASSKWIGANPWSCGERNIVEDKLTEWVIDRCCPVAYPCHPTDDLARTNERVAAFARFVGNPSTALMFTTMGLALRAVSFSLMLAEIIVFVWAVQEMIGVLIEYDGSLD